MNNKYRAAFPHASNWITVCTDLGHIVEVLKIHHGMSWDWRRMSWMRNAEEVGLYISKTGVLMDMQ